MKFIKHFGILLLIIFSFLLVDQYFFTPQYIVKAPSPFLVKAFIIPTRVHHFQRFILLIYTDIVTPGEVLQMVMVIKKLLRKFLIA